MGVGAVTAPAFDPWAALQSRREAQPPPKAPDPANPRPLDQVGLAGLAGLGEGHPAPAHLHEGDPLPLPGVPPEWCQGVAQLATMPAPPTIPPRRWAMLAANAARLLRDHGAELHAAGWDVLDLFGLHAGAPAEHPPGWGLAWLLGASGEVLDVAPDVIGMRRGPDGARLAYRRRSASRRAGLALAWHLPGLASPPEGLARAVPLSTA